jgi:hypothetical protein
LGPVRAVNRDLARRDSVNQGAASKGKDLADKARVGQGRASEVREQVEKGREGRAKETLENGARRLSCESLRSVPSNSRPLFVLKGLEPLARGYRLRSTPGYKL